jgi:hypothetical protein
MDDLDVIRFAVVDNITRERIARAGMEVKGNFGDAGGSAQTDYLPPLEALPPSESTVFREKHLSRWRNAETEDSAYFGPVPRAANPRRSTIWDATSKGIVEDEKGA